MNTSIHGHEVLNMMLEAKDPYTVESLNTAIVARFGAEARFHTCGATDLSARGLIEFLAARGKFTSVGAGFVFVGQTCAHEGRHDHHHSA